MLRLSGRFVTFAGLDPLAVCQMVEGETVRGGATRAGASPRPPRTPQLTFVDAGLVVRLSEQDRTNFLELFQAIAQGDGAKAGRLMLSRSREHHCTNPGFTPCAPTACTLGPSTGQSPGYL